MAEDEEVLWQVFFTSDLMTLTFMCFVCAGAKRVGVNPKVNNMVQGYELARHGLILISDCGLRSTYLVFNLLTGSIARSAKRRLFNIPRGRF